jgi:hypothetical protein
MTVDYLKDMSLELFSPCGINCSSCPWFKGERDPKCPGCKVLEGKPFWGTCQTYDCIKTHNFEHCGLCNEFPCKDFMNRYDPREGPINALMRAGLLAYRAKYGDKEALMVLEQAENYEKPE